MSVISKKQIKAALMEFVHTQVSNHGFALMANKDRFTRSHGGITDIFQLVYLDYESGYRIQPNVAVRIDFVEEIFHLTSGFDFKHQKDTPTMGGSVGGIIKGDAGSCEYLIKLPSDIADAGQQIVHVFQEFALPYFERYQSLILIDSELNNHPLDRTPHRGVPWLRCATGLIVAKMVGRTNYKALVETYSDVLTRSDKGFYLSRFKALVESLELQHSVEKT